MDLKDAPSGSLHISKITLIDIEIGYRKVKTNQIPIEV